MNKGRRAAAMFIASMFAFVCVALAQNGPSCQAGIDQDNAILAKIRDANKRYSDALDRDDACGQLKADKERLSLARARMPIRSRMASDCIGFHSSDGSLIVASNEEKIASIKKQIERYEGNLPDEEEGCRQASASTNKPMQDDVGPFDINSPGMLRCQKAVNACLSSARSAYSACATEACKTLNGCMSKCGNDFGARNVRCNTYGSQCFKDPNHDDAKLISAIGAPLP